MAPKTSKQVNPKSKKSQRQLKHKAAEAESLFVSQESPENAPRDAAAEPQAVGGQPRRSSRAKGPTKYAEEDEEPNDDYTPSSPETTKRKATSTKLPARKALAMSQASSEAEDTASRKTAAKAGPKQKKTGTGARQSRKGARKTGNEDEQEYEDEPDEDPTDEDASDNQPSSSVDPSDVSSEKKSKNKRARKPRAVQVIGKRPTLLKDMDPNAEYDIIDEDGILLPFYKTQYAKIYRRADTTYIERYSKFIEQRKRLLEGEYEALPRLNATVDELIEQGMALPDNRKVWQMNRRKRPQEVLDTIIDEGMPHVRLRQKHPPQYTLMTTVHNIADPAVPLVKLERMLSETSPPATELVKDDVLDRFADAVEALMNTWPSGLPDDIRSRCLLVDVALQYAAGSADFVGVKSPYWISTDGWNVEIPHIERTTGLAGSYQYNFAQPFHFRVRPRLNPRTQFYAGKSLFDTKKGPQERVLKREIVDGGAVFASLLPAQDAISRHPVVKRKGGEVDYQGYLDAELLCRTVICELAGAIASKDEMAEHRKRIEAFYRAVRPTKPRTKKPMLARLGDFAWPWFTRHQTLNFNLQDALIPVLGMHSAGTVRTVDGRWLGWLYDKQRAVIRRTSNPFQMILEWWHFLDLINILRATGALPPPACECDDISRMYTLHACHHCLDEVPCLELIGSLLDARYCANCANSERVDYVTRSLGLSIEGRIRTLILRDIGAHDLSQDDPFVQQLIEETTEVAQAQQQGTIVDHFNNVYRQEQVPYTVGVSAFAISHDAIFPFFRHSSGRTIAHSPANIGACYYYENIGKGKKLPGTSMLIAEYVRGALTEDELLQALDQFSVVELGIPFHRKSCIKHISEDHWRAVLYEFKTGRVLNPSNLSRRQRQAGSLHDARVNFNLICPLDLEKRQDLANVAWGIARLADPKNPERLLYRAHDGALWPTALGPPPDGYDWDVWYSIMHWKVLVLTITCNRRHTTTITVFTMFLEIFWGVCFRQGLLNLPLRLETRHGCSLSVGHKIHGQDMVKRFNENAKTVDDRSDEECNIVVESWPENAMRLHFSEQEVTRIPGEVEKFFVSTEYYDPSAARPDDLVDHIFPTLHVGEVDDDGENDDASSSMGAFEDEDADYAVAGADEALTGGTEQLDIDMADSTMVEPSLEPGDQPAPFMKAVPKDDTGFLTSEGRIARTLPIADKKFGTTPKTTAGTASDPIEASGDIPGSPIEGLDALRIKPPTKPALQSLLAFDLDYYHSKREYYPWNPAVVAMLEAYDKGLYHQHNGKVRMSPETLATAIRVNGIQLPCPRGILSLRPNQEGAASFVDTDTLAFLLEDSFRDVEIPVTTVVIQELAPLTFMTSVQHGDDLLSEPDSFRAVEKVLSMIRNLMGLPYEDKLKEEQFVQLPEHCTDLHLVLNAGIHFAAVHYHVDFNFNAKGEREAGGRGSISIRESLSGKRLHEVARRIPQYWSLHPAHAWCGTTWQSEPHDIPSPKQGNGNDCGLYAWTALVNAVTGTKPDFFYDELSQRRQGEELRANAFRAIARRAGVQLPEKFRAPAPTDSIEQDSKHRSLRPQYATTATLKDGTRKKLTPKTLATVKRPLSTTTSSATLKQTPSLVSGQASSTPAPRSLGPPDNARPQTFFGAPDSARPKTNEYANLMREIAAQVARLNAFVAKAASMPDTASFGLIPGAYALIASIASRAQLAHGQHVVLTAPGIFAWGDA